MTTATATLTTEEELARYRATFGPLPEEQPEGTKPAKTHVLNIVDMSGSMAGLAEDVRGGFNTYIDGLRGEQGDYRITVTVFDTVFEPLCTDAALADVPRLTELNYAPRGMTALLDAVGKTVTEFESRVTLADGERVLVVIQTDGHENSSREYGWEAIQELIKTREATGRWSFIYLGAGADTWAQAGLMGVAAANYVNTDNTADGTARSYSGLTQATVAYAAAASGAEASEILRGVAGK